MITRGGPRIGIAIGADRLWVAAPGTRAGGAGQVWSCDLDPRALGEGDPAELSHAFAELAAEHRIELATGAEASVALLPPLAEARHVVLPRLRADERRAVLTRDASRHFLMAAGPSRSRWVADGWPAPRSAASPEPLLAASAAEALVTAVADAVRGAGWRLATILPAHSAWLAAARSSSDGHAIVVSVPDGGSDDEACLEILVAAAGEVPLVRRARPRRALAILEKLYAPADPGALARPVTLIGDPSMIGPIGDALAARGATVSLASSADAGAVAALHVMQASGPELVAGVVRVERARRSRGLTMRLAAVAATLAAAAVGLAWWDAERELDVLRAHRAEQRIVVGKVLDAREAIGRLGDRVAIMDSLERSAPRWTTAFALLGAHLPRDAHLSAVRARGDTLVLEGVGHRAASVIEALRGAPGVASVRLDAPVRSEASGASGVEPLERFTLLVRLAAPGRGRVATDSDGMALR